MTEFERCIQKGSLKQFTDAGQDAVGHEIRAAREDLNDAEFVFANDMPKRTTITAYYAMFHAARALVLAKGYAEKSHYCLLVAFRALYGQDGEGRELAQGIEQARTLRENADYLTQFSPESAEAILAVARRFVAFAEDSLR